MGISQTIRTASFDEVVSEMDRRGEVIEALEAKLSALETAFFLPGNRRRLFWISELLAKQGHFNRFEIVNVFGVSVPQASIDIQCWIRENPGAAAYIHSRRRYEATKADSQ